ncbi:DUF4286 family protein [Flectobacillus major]|uniref:DUF4286 family protein n=1 Tax=Flectobacillus major TaxID=103 RepID=UPI0004795917|nr:DUF4286 family protein [Flectobacillus major]
MLLHNITFNIDTNEELDFLQWMKSNHVPAVMQTGLPTSFKVLKLLTEVNNGGSTFSFQYSFETPETFETFETVHFDDIIQKVDERYRGKYVFFASLLQEL